MTFESAIHFIVSHNATIIQGLVSLILLLVIIVSYRMFMGGGEPVAEPASSASMAHLEETIKSLLERASSIPTPVDGSESAPLVAEIQKLKSSLEEKQGQIEKLKVEHEAQLASTAVGSGSGAAGGAQMDAGEKSALEGQLKELQAKLAEYEIISEDIADLSFFKEENAKLQKELEALKKGGGAVAAAAPASAPTSEPALSEPVSTPIAHQQTVIPDIPKPSPAIVGAAAATKAAEASQKNTGEGIIDDDLMSQFAAAIDAQQNAPPELKIVENVAEDPLGVGLDVDKVAAEVEALNETDSGINALESELDAEKLLEEAAKMDAIKPEDRKLMNEFESFVKKGGVA